MASRRRTKLNACNCIFCAPTHMYHICRTSFAVIIYEKVRHKRPDCSKCATKKAAARKELRFARIQELLRTRDEAIRQKDGGMSFKCASECWSNPSCADLPAEVRSVSMQVARSLFLKHMSVGAAVVGEWNRLLLSSSCVGEGRCRRRGQEARRNIHQHFCVSIKTQAAAYECREILVDIGIATCVHAAGQRVKTGSMGGKRPNQCTNGHVVRLTSRQRSCTRHDWDGCAASNPGNRAMVNRRERKEREEAS